jgi:hypothetical protein
MNDPQTSTASSTPDVEVEEDIRSWARVLLASPAFDLNALQEENTRLTTLVTTGVSTLTSVIEKLREENTRLTSVIEKLLEGIDARNKKHLELLIWKHTRLTAETKAAKASADAAEASADDAEANYYQTLSGLSFSPDVQPNQETSGEAGGLFSPGGEPNPVMLGESFGKGKVLYFPRRVYMHLLFD